MVMDFLVDAASFIETISEPPPRAGRILVCEDEGLTALRLRRILATLGYEVVGEARDGEEAVRLAGRLQPDIILMDIHMPKLDGIGATRLIMRDCPTTVVILTAYSERELVQRALEAGASGYLVKPIAEDQLHPALSVARTRFAELRQEREVAHTLARSFQGEAPAIPGFQVASRYEPAFEAARVGGDFFDFIDLGAERVGIVMGDVCGKGMTAATYTGMARHMLRAYCLEDPAPAQVLSRLNRALHHQMSEENQFITAVYGVLDRHKSTFTFATAGHPPPVWHDPARQLSRELKGTGGVLGVLPEMHYAEASVALAPESVLALFTDGVTEAHTAASMMGEAGVAAVLRDYAAQDAETISEAILEEARRFAGGFLRDDLAIVVLKRTGSDDSSNGDAEGSSTDL